MVFPGVVSLFNRCVEPGEAGREDGQRKSESDGQAVISEQQGSSANGEPVTGAQQRRAGRTRWIERETADCVRRVDNRLPAVSDERKTRERRRCGICGGVRHASPLLQLSTSP